MNIVVLTNFYKDIIYRFTLFELNLLFFEDYTVLWNEFNFSGSRSSMLSRIVEQVIVKVQ